MKTITNISVFLLIFFASQNIFAVIHYVSKTGGHVSPFTSWANAATNIQDAVDVAVSNDSPIGGIKRFSIVVGLLLLLFHLQLGLLCLGLASIHDKFNTRDEANDITVDDSGKVVYCPSCGKQVEVEPGDKVCYHCGGQL